MRTEIVIPFAFDTAPLEKLLQEQGEDEVMKILTKLVEENVISRIPKTGTYGKYYGDSRPGEPDWNEFLANRFYKWLDDHTEDIIDEAALLLVQKGSRKKKWREVLAEMKEEWANEMGA
jgi:hypothetical protein